MKLNEIIYLVAASLFFTSSPLVAANSVDSTTQELQSIVNQQFNKDVSGNPGKKTITAHESIVFTKGFVEKSMEYIYPERATRLEQQLSTKPLHKNTMRNKESSAPKDPVAELNRLAKTFFADLDTGNLMKMALGERWDKLSPTMQDRVTKQSRYIHILSILRALEENLSSPGDIHYIHYECRDKKCIVHAELTPKRHNGSIKANATFFVTKDANNRMRLYDLMINGSSVNSEIVMFTKNIIEKKGADSFLDIIK